MHTSQQYKHFHLRRSRGDTLICYDNIWVVLHPSRCCCCCCNCLFGVLFYFLYWANPLNAGRKGVSKAYKLANSKLILSVSSINSSSSSSVVSLSASKANNCIVACLNDGRGVLGCASQSSQPGDANIERKTTQNMKQNHKARNWNWKMKKQEGKLASFFCFFCGLQNDSWLSGIETDWQTV